MSTIDSREQLIQQRQAEKYINVIRMTLLGFLTAALLIEETGLAGVRFLGDAYPPVVLAAAWLYALSVQWSVSRGFFPRYLPWMTTVFDLVLIGVGFASELNSSHRSAADFSTDLTWGYALLFLLILFSTLRERAVVTLVNGFVGTALYAGFLLLNFPTEPHSGFWVDQGFRMVFLLLAGLFSGFHARSVSKSFQRAAHSDRLRRETDARLKVLAQHFPGVLFQAEVTAAGFRLVYVSEGSQDLLGIAPEEMTGNPQLFLKQTTRAARRELRLQFGDEGEAQRKWEVEFPFRVRGGQLTWFRISATTHLSRQGTKVVNGLVSDISEQRLAGEALREANQAKTDFLATMSHELRTPLNAILGNSDHLSRLAETEDDKRAFRDVQASGETLLGLIEDILVFSRLEAGRLVAEVRPFTWKPQLEALIDIFQSAATAKGLILSAHFPPGAPTWIWTDLLRLRQVVSNLIGNAVKFTPAGRVTVSVSFEPGDQLPWFVVEVADTGIGIASEHLERIFDKFTQGQHGKSRSYGGLGLGLSIGRSLSQLLGGSLAVSSAPGKGSTFTLRIPVRTGDSSGEPSAPGNEPLEPRRTIRVLLVEDNLTNQDVAMRMLKKLGTQVDVASGGREAVELASKSFYDLIFMDWQMPVMDGREATARIRALPGGQDLVIVALSGHALPGDREHLLASGFDDYLSKPVRMDDFRVTLTKWVRNPQAPS